MRLQEFGELNFMQTTKKPLKKSQDLFNGFLLKPVVKNDEVNTTIGAQEGTRTPTKLLAST